MALRGKLPTNVKAVESRSNGMRIEGADLTPHLLEFALNNRDQFTFIYTGDRFEPEREPAKVILKDSSPVFSPSDLSRMNKAALLDVCEKRGILAEGEPTNAELVEMILQDQYPEG